MDNAVPSFLGFLGGFIGVVVGHRHIHNIGWIYRALVIVGLLGVCGGCFTYIKGNALNEAHIPTGMLSGLEYVLMMGFGVLIIILGLLLLASAGLGCLSGKMYVRVSKNLG